MSMSMQYTPKPETNTQAEMKEIGTRLRKFKRWLSVEPADSKEGAARVGGNSGD